MIKGQKRVDCRLQNLKKHIKTFFKVISSRTEVLPFSPLDHGSPGGVLLICVISSRTVLAGFHKVNGRVFVGVPKK